MIIFTFLEKYHRLIVFLILFINKLDSVILIKADIIQKIGHHTEKLGFMRFIDNQNIDNIEMQG